jgi:ubiquinone/menaquinone biosynthesis C-methylase UbiE
MQILSARWVAHTIGAAAEFRLADHLAGGPLPSTEVARLAGTNADATRRLLRALASHGIFTETEPGVFANTPASDVLRSDVPGSMRPMLVYSFAQHTAEAWAALPHAVATGESAFRHAHGVGTWDYLQSHPEAAATFDAAMTSNSRREAAAILEAYDFGRFETLVDVAGGAGLLLASVLAKHERLRGVLFDLPHAIEHARAVVGASPVADRCKLVAGNAFDGVPEGADAYMMKHILHDWSDAESLRFLASIHRAARPGATLLVLDAVIEPGNGPQWAKLLDINMLVMTEGRERTEAEFEDLLRRGGFTLERVARTAAPICVLEARRA